LDFFQLKCPLRTDSVDWILERRWRASAEVPVPESTVPLPPFAAGFLPAHSPAALAGTGYRLVRRIGQGGTADVYEAEHVWLRKRVVVKVLQAKFEVTPMYIERMRLEAQTLARVTHQNLVAVSDFGLTLEGRPFFVMERLEGQTLLEELRSRSRLGGMPVELATEFTRQLLAGLGAVHAAGVIHRDIKLENLFLCAPDETGRRTLKILDFGIAKVLRGADPLRAPEPLALRSQEGVPIGTPRFLSPEQVQCGEVDARTDVYGAGVVLYELLTGRDPFFHIHGYAELLEAHVTEMPRPPSLVATQPIAPELDAIVMRALAKRPEDRHASAEAFSAALAHARPSRPARVPPLPSGPRARFGLGGWLALVVVGFSALIALLIQRIL
jgi:serine/threonine-protein kinase